MEQCGVAEGTGNFLDGDDLLVKMMISCSFNIGLIDGNRKLLTPSCDILRYQGNYPLESASRLFPL